MDKSISGMPLRKYRHPILDKQTEDDVLAILRSGRMSMYRGTPQGVVGGEWIQKFEKAFADYHSIKHAIAVSNGTAGLHTALLALGIDKYREVITTPLTFSASASCIKMIGADIRFVDVDRETFNIDAYKITEEADCIIPVHLMGNLCDMERILSYNMPVIEDACQALGAEIDGKKAGTFGKLGVFSFNQSKPIAVGEGGMIITNDDDLADKCRAIRNHAEVSVPSMGRLGYNYRMCEIEACIGYNQLLKLDEMIAMRIELANKLTTALKGIAGLTPQKCNGINTYFTYGMVVDGAIGRDHLQRELLDKGIYFGQGGYKPLYKFPFYKTQEKFPNADFLYENMMFTDILRYPMTDADLNDMIKAIKESL